MDGSTHGSTLFFHSLASADEMGVRGGRAIVTLIRSRNKASNRDMSIVPLLRHAAHIIYLLSSCQTHFCADASASLPMAYLHTILKPEVVIFLLTNAGFDRR